VVHKYALTDDLFLFLRLMMMTTANPRKTRGISQEIYSAVNIKLFVFEKLHI